MFIPVYASCTSTSALGTHFLTSQIAHPQAKVVCDYVLHLGVGVFGAGEGAVWVADSGATFHVTGNPMLSLAADPLPPPVRKSEMRVRRWHIGDMRSLEIEQQFGEMSMGTRTASGGMCMRPW